MSFSGLILTIAGGLIFGVIKGTILNVIASNIGANIAFFIGRYFVRDFVEKLIKGKIKLIDDKIETNGFLTILRLRLIPIIPFNILNYAAGFSKLKYNDYIFGTVIGMLPATFIYTFFADAILIDSTKQKEAFFKLIIATTLLVAISFIPNIFRVKINKVVKKIDL
ncbi:MAG: TVP38/TMEM64 family protein [Candidatus Sericytochromatia bacterium]|nr:TVP38/TMEM64 family protein [Candidatus Sericytochromatia bacterium]